jgi:multiple sugar transport system substrate-binding protein
MFDGSASARFVGAPSSPQLFFPPFPPEFSMPVCDPSTTVGRLLSLLLLGAAVILPFAGCQGDPQEQPKVAKPVGPERPMRVIVVDDAPFAETLQRQWSARTDSQLELQQMSAAQLEQAQQLSADVVVYPSECLGTLAHRNLIIVPTESVRRQASYDLPDVFDLQRNAEVRWGDQTYAFSFGSPQLVLMYRADLFARRLLEPPKTWTDYQRLVEQLTRETLGDLAPAADQTWSPVCEPLAPGWASKLLLARAATYAAHPSQFSILFDYSTMEPLIDRPPFVRALGELVATAKVAAAKDDKPTPELARRRVLAGQAAMALTWPSRATVSSGETNLAGDVEVAFAPLPGATVAYNFGEQEWTPHESDRSSYVPLIGVAGRLGSVTRRARRPRDAADILALLTGKEWSELLSPVSAHTTMFRFSQLDSPQPWTDSVLTVEASEGYAEVVEATQQQPIHVSSIRIPGYREYLEALDQAVYNSIWNNMSPQDALNETAEAWRKITERLGVEPQREAYTRSLGLEP